jgi:hypothetical protein
MVYPLFKNSRAVIAYNALTGFKTSYSLFTFYPWLSAQHEADHAPQATRRAAIAISALTGVKSIAYMDYTS